MKRFFRRLKRAASVDIRICLILFPVAVLLHVLSACSAAFADFYTRHIGIVFRNALAYATCWFPFSLSELILMSAPLILIALIVYCVRLGKRSQVAGTRFTLRLISFILALYSLFVFCFIPAYHGTSLSQKLDLTDRPVTAKELDGVTEILIDALNELAPECNYAPDDFSVCPHTMKELSAKLCDTYSDAQDAYPFISPLRSRVKTIMHSEPMTYTHISGVYSYFTGEANINTNFPDYSIPYTVAHEFAHQRGIAREDEANFVAYLICIRSEDPYIRYSGYLSMYEYVANALYQADPELYFRRLGMLDMRVRKELSAFSAFFDPYRKTVVSDVSNAINDTYLKLQGTEGSKSYGLVVDLAVAYYAGVKVTAD